MINSIQDARTPICKPLRSLKDIAKTKRKSWKKLKKATKLNWRSTLFMI